MNRLLGKRGPEGESPPSPKGENNSYQSEYRPGRGGKSPPDVQKTGKKTTLLAIVRFNKKGCPRCGPKNSLHSFFTAKKRGPGPGQAWPKPRGEATECAEGLTSAWVVGGGMGRRPFNKGFVKKNRIKMVS